MAIAVTNDASVFKRSANAPTITSYTIWGWFNFTSVTPARFWGPLGLYAGTDGAPGGGGVQYVQVSSASSGSSQLVLGGGTITNVNLINTAANTWYFIALNGNALAAGGQVAYARAITSNTLSVASSAGLMTTFTPARAEWGRECFTGDFISGSIHACGMADVALSVDELLELSYFHEPQLDGIRSLNVFYPCIESVNTNAVVDRSGNARNATATVGALADSPPLLWRAIPPPWNLPASAASGDMSGLVALSLTPVGAMTGAGALAGTVALTITPAGALSGAGALAGSVPLTITPAGTLIGIGALAGSVPLSITPVGALSGAGALIGSVSLTIAPAGALSGTGALNGAVALAFAPVGALSGAGALTGSVSVSFAVAGALTDASSPSGDMAGSVASVFTINGTLSGAGALGGLVALDFGIAGLLSDAGAPSTTGPFASGGGGGIDYQRQRRDHRRPHKELKSLLDEALPEVYAELNSGPKEVAAQARAIVKPFKEGNAVDWAALDANANAVGRLLALVGRARSAAAAASQRAALQAHDENWFLMS